MTWRGVSGPHMASCVSYFETPGAFSPAERDHSSATQLLRRALASCHGAGLQLRVSAAKEMRACCATCAWTSCGETRRLICSLMVDNPLLSI